MKKILGTVAALILLVVVAAVATLLFVESPGKTIEALALKHADKLPLAYIGEKLFDGHCASCHDNPAMHAPTREALTGFSKETIMVALEFGKMAPMATHLSKQEKGLIAIYLAGAAPADVWVDSHRCKNEVADSGEAYVTDWGIGTHNQRNLSNSVAGIDRENVASLQLAWSLAFPKVTDMRSQPAIVGDTLYFGDKTGSLYAINRHTGCVRKHMQVVSGIRSAITVVQRSTEAPLLVFADSMATVYAVNAENFEIEWQQAARLYDTSVITGSITHHAGRLYVPISSYEVAVAGGPGYVCCKSHGGVVALDAQSGEEIWAWHGTADATLQGQNADGLDQYGPSGVSVWSTPTVDEKRNRLYVGTGENLSLPSTTTSDAVVALELETGELVWHFQATADDAWNSACLNEGANCPENPGGDFDIGASIILTQLPDGRDALLVGQKSGDVYALSADPGGDGGEVLWHRVVSNAGIGPDLHKTTTNGGVHWGMSVSGERLLVAASDPERIRAEYVPRPGLHALNVTDGSIDWFQSVERGCHIPDENKPLVGLQNMRAGKKIDLATQYSCSFYYGLSAALTTTEDLVFSAGLDGKVRSFDLETGELLWQTETARPIDANNGVSGHGGAIDVSGPLPVGGWLYLQSGYSMFGQLPGNVLLAYKLGP